MLFIGGVAIYYMAMLSVAKAHFTSIETLRAASALIGGNQLRAPPAMA